MSKFKKERLTKTAVFSSCQEYFYFSQISMDLIIETKLRYHLRVWFSCLSYIFYVSLVSWFFIGIIVLKCWDYIQGLSLCSCFIKRAFWDPTGRFWPCERLAGKRLVVTRLFLPVKKIALDFKPSGIFYWSQDYILILY